MADATLIKARRTFAAKGWKVRGNSIRPSELSQTARFPVIDKTKAKMKTRADSDRYWSPLTVFSRRLLEDGFASACCGLGFRFTPQQFPCISARGGCVVGAEAKTDFIKAMPANSMSWPRTLLHCLGQLHVCSAAQAKA